MILDYLLTLSRGKTKLCNGPAFHKWCKANNEQVGSTFQIRLDQFCRFTGLNVKDWEMIDL